MLHGVRLRGGRAEWYRNRWVRTAALAGRPFLTDTGVDRTAVVANTHVVEHAGRLLALVESGFPYEVDGELGTIGPCDFDGRLTTAMTAHPKTDPVTGEMHFFGYSPFPPYLTYHRLSAAGELVVSRPVEVPGPTMMHDFAITEHHVVWLDLPMTFSAERLGRSMPFAWDESYGARLGVMRFDDPASRVQWFEVDPCYVFHVGTAHEDRVAEGRQRPGRPRRRAVRRRGRGGDVGRDDRAVDDRDPALDGGRRRGDGGRTDAPLDARPGHRRRHRDPTGRPARRVPDAGRRPGRAGRAPPLRGGVVLARGTRS